MERIGGGKLSKVSDMGGAQDLSRVEIFIQGEITHLFKKAIYKGEIRG